MSFYDTTLRLYLRFGRTADFPATPPDKSILFWNIQTGIMYAVNDAMEWVVINPPFPASTGEAHWRVKDIATSISPDALVFAVPSLGALVTECRFVLEDAYDVGITLSVGDAGDHERLMAIADIDPQTPGTYRTLPTHQYAAGSGIYIYMNTSSTTGSGTLYIFYDEHPSTL